MKTHFLTSSLVLTGLMMAGPLSQARILADDEAAQAATTILQSEARLFSSIRMGIALSMAQCEGRELCSPNVNSEEVQRLLQTLDTRIEDLTLKQESVEDPEAFQEVLSLYVEERDNYSSVLEKLGPIEDDIDAVGIEEEVVDFENAELEETLSEDDLFTDEAADTAITDDTLEFFEDSDEELLDDESLKEFDDDFEPEAVESVE